MKKLLPLLVSGALLIGDTAPALAQTAARYYAVEQNKASIPFPSDLPALKPEASSSFDWGRYVEESTSTVDRLYRLNLALGYLDSPKWRNELGAGASTADEGQRARMAAEAIELNCAAYENTYRDRLKDQPQLITSLNQFITSHRQAIEASVKLVGGSWGGSGVKAAYPLAKLKAFAIYRLALLDLRSSLDLQDIPEIPLGSSPVAHPR